MKKIDLFDTFENAEDELMEDFTDMSPKIDDEQFEKLLAVSERNYKMKKEEIERTKKDTNINYDADSVSGVDRVKRPVWLAPLLTAASLVLVTGAVIGSIALLSRDGKGVGGKNDFLTATTSTAENTTITTTVTATGTAVTGASGTTVTTTEAETVNDTVTSETSGASQTGETPVEPYLNRYALDLYIKSADVNNCVTCVGVQCSIEYIKFAVDPEAGYWVYDHDKSNGEWTNEYVYYFPVNDERFSSYDEMKRYLRSIFTENSFVCTWFSDNFKTGFDDVEVGGYLDSSKVGTYIEYRGKLYMFAPSGGIGYVPAVYSDKYPVIITNKTDTSFTAYITEFNGNESDFPDLENCSCAQVNFVLDPEYNDWRINDITPRQAPYYKNMYDMFYN